ncbi:MAG: hypothetical protein M3Z04_14485 [Chloroflexota bacterium]|nr:hypothetical protein [Chloroflexota bacterium]
MPEPSADPRDSERVMPVCVPSLPERDDLGYWLNRAGLSSLAAPLGEMVRPFAWLGAQALLVLQPTLSLFGTGPAVARLADRWAAWDAPARPPAPVTEEEPCR